MPKTSNLNWKWNKGLEPSNRSMSEIIESMHKSVIEKDGRLYTEEEAIALTDGIRAELRKAGKIK